MNFISSGAVGSTIAGGGTTNYGGFTYPNSILASLSLIGGGSDNRIAPGGSSCVIGGGSANDIYTNSTHCFIGGGRGNNIFVNSSFGVIAGGFNNGIGTGSVHGVIAGGDGNFIASDSSSSVIVGGLANDISNDSDYSVVGGGYANITGPGADYATIPGGTFNFATTYAFAAGRRAKANHPGSFIWCDSLNQDGGSQGTNSFTVRASGGVHLFTSGGATGVVLPAGSGSWTSLSDRAVKTNFAPVNSLEVLKRLANIPVQSWNYIAQGDHVRHLGPMAQDFHAAFGLGTDERHIATVDADGVALAAIQGLNEKVESENAALRAENRALKARLDRLERLIERAAPAN